MSDLISREDAIKDAESWVAVDEYEKHLKEIVIEWIKEFPPAELSTNLAAVGTDCISRQAAMDALDQGFKDTTNGIDKLSPTYGLTKAMTGIYKCYIGKLSPIRPRRGRWHYSDGKPARIGLSFGVICDQCGTESEYCTNFCGECGADMRSDDMREATT